MTADRLYPREVWSETESEEEHEHTRGRRVGVRAALDSEHRRPTRCALGRSGEGEKRATRKRPFTGGTYLASEARFYLPGFPAREFK